MGYPEDMWSRSAVFFPPCFEPSIAENGPRQEFHFPVTRPIRLNGDILVCLRGCVNVADFCPERRLFFEAARRRHRRPSAAIEYYMRGIWTRARGVLRSRSGLLRVFAHLTRGQHRRRRRRLADRQSRDGVKRRSCSRVKLTSRPSSTSSDNTY